MISKNITITATKNWQNKPTKPGIYLMRNQKVKDELVLLYKSAFGLSVMGSRGVADILTDDKFAGCKWFGPIKL